MAATRSPWSGDVSSEDDVIRYVGEVLDAWGRIDILINNAALLGGRGVLEESLEFWNRAVAVAGAGTFLNTKHVAISMIEREIKGLDRQHPVLERLAGLRRRDRLRVPQGRAGQLHAGGGDGPGAVRDPRELLLADRATPGQPRAAGRAVRAGGFRRRPATSSERPAWWREPGKIDVRGNMPMAPSTPTDIGHCVAWMCSDYARLITGCDFVIDGGARAKYWGYTPPADKAEPIPLIPLYEDETMPGGF